MRELDRRVHAGEQLNPAESYAWRKWAGHLAEEKEKVEEEKNFFVLLGLDNVVDISVVPTVSPQTLGIPVVMQRQVSTMYSFMLPVQFLDAVFDTPVVVLRQVPGLMVQKTVVRPQLQSIEGRRLSLSFSRGSSSWSRLFTRPQRFSSCHSISGRRCPCCAGS